MPDQCVVLAAVVAVMAVVANARVSYEGHKILSIPITSLSTANILFSLSNTRDVDVMSNDGLPRVGREAVVRVSPAGYAQVAATGLVHRVTVEDVQRHIEEVERVSSYSGMPGGIEDDWFHHWHDFDDIVNKLGEMEKKFPEVVKVIPEIGTSHEGRKIAGLKIGLGEPGKCNVTAIIAGTHAREWIAEGVAMWTTEQLLEDYEAGVEEVRNLLKNNLFYMIPCYNPDGYMYSRTDDRYWRKNRRDNGDGSYGVDQNRNWDNHFCEYGSSKSTGSDTYCGPSAFSEPETKAVSEWLKTLGHVRSMVDFHSCAAEVLRPYGWTHTPIPDDSRVSAEGKQIVKLIKSVHGTVYESIRAIDLYIHSGIALDWAYGANVASSSFTFELAGDDFVVPESDIQKQGEEIYPVVKYLLSLALL